MNNELVDFFHKNICEMCNDKQCKRKPHRMLKCGIFYLIKISKK